MRLSPRLGAVLVAVVFLAFHVRYVPRSLEDLDSINFALGVRHYDVPGHQPHPPGYPLFVLAAKISRRIFQNDALALAAPGIAAGTLGVFVLVLLFRGFDRAGGMAPSRSAGPPGSPPDVALWAALAAVTAPLYWFTASRPLSDMTGLVAALAVQALTLGGGTGLLVTASFCAALAAGIRSQVVWLTVPLIVVAVLRRKEPARDRARLAGACALALTVGGLLWGVPLVVLSGGPAAYWHALFSQGAEDLTGIQMLWTRPTPRELLVGLYYAFVAPWARWEAAAVVILLAMVGLARLARSSRETLVALAAAFGPYLVFDLLFQETFTTRYALPLVVPMAYLAARGARAAGFRPGLTIVALLAIFDAHVAGTSLAAYASQEAPVFRLLDDMRSAEPGPAGPVLAADRRESLDLARPLVWLGDRVPRLSTRLAAPPNQEWLEAVKYWNGGGRAPVWFLVDPLRAQIDLVEHGEPQRYRWSLPYPVLLGGVRPSEMDWYRVERPEWYVGEGWSLTPETAGIADRDRRGLDRQPISAWISRPGLGGTLVVGGRNFDAQDARVAIDVGGVVVSSFVAGPGAFLSVVPLHGAGPGEAPLADADYAQLTVRAAPATHMAVEQFDYSRTRPVFGFGNGWHEQEFNPATGLRWRWVSRRGELRLADGRALVLHLEGESPRTYFARPSRLVVREGGTVLHDQALSSDFTLDVPIPAGPEPAASRIITIEADQEFVPAEQSRRTQDRRHLALRMFKVRIAAAS